MRQRLPVISGSAWLWSWLLLSPLLAQDAWLDTTVKHIPMQALGVVTLWPEALAEREQMQLAPLEVITAAGLENVGIDPLQIARIDVMIGFPAPTGPQFGVLVQSSVPLDLAAMNPQLLASGEGIDDGGFRYLELAGPPATILHPLNANSVILGTKGFVKQMALNGAPDSPLAAIVGSVKSQQDLLAVVSVQTLRPLLQGMAQGAPVPPDLLADMQTVVASTEFLAVRLVLGQPERLQIVLASSDQAAATTNAASLDNLLQFTRDQLVQQAKAEVPADSLTGQAMHQYIDRVAAHLTQTLQPTQSGNRLVYELSDFQNMGVIGTLTGLLLPAVQSARQAARRVDSMNNLKLIGLAFHNFADAYDTLPATAGLDNDGQPMLSWRVALLPFLDEMELYNQFHLDEPWDSEHNLTLLEKMPDVFRHAGRATQPGYTVYQAPVGEETLLRLKEPTKFRDITDGTSNTILAVETTAERAVPWTAPKDYELDMEDPHAGLFDGPTGNFLFGDGSVQALSAAVDLQILRALFTRAGGEVVNRP